MDNKMPLISYTLAAMSGICFLGGLIILSREGRKDEWTDLRGSYPCSTIHLTQEGSDTSQEVFS
jgi:hypothetical protein